MSPAPIACPVCHRPDRTACKCGAGMEQIEQVGEMLDLGADDYLRWPWPDLDAVMGGMARGTVHYPVAFSGLGKTTFIASAINRWLDQGKRIEVMPLELPPAHFRAYLACQRLGIDPGFMFSGDYLRDAPDPATLRQRVYDEAARMAEPPYASRLFVHEPGEVNLGALTAACQSAARRNAHALVVDHIDHIGDDTTDADVQVSARVNRAAPMLAIEYGLCLILTSQANGNALRINRDHLAKFAPLRDTDVWMGLKKRQVATTMFGLFRPPRLRDADETVEQYVEQIKRARAGDIEPGEVLMPGVTGINVMKHRNYGSREGRRVYLGWDAGTIVDLAPDHARGLTAQLHAIRTNRDAT